jgi:serine/threonine-protein kinase RsbW
MTMTPPHPARLSSQSGTLATSTHTQAFPGIAASVPHARHWLTSLLDGLPAASDAALCLSELATNAIEHSRSGQPGGIFTVLVTLHPVLHVEGADEGGPWEPHPDPDGLRGRGLTIVAQLAGDSGITDGYSGRTAWFTMHGSSPAQRHYRIDLPKATAPPSAPWPNSVTAKTSASTSSPLAPL